MNPTELIRVLGPILFGPRWQTDMAVTLGINPRSVRRWAAGDDIPRAGVWAELARMMRTRQEEFARLLPLVKRQAGAETDVGAEAWATRRT